MNLRVNGKKRKVDVPPMKRLLDTLREDLGLTGTKEGCGEGECGACTVLIDGVAVNSCLVPTCQVEGCRVTTVEGLAKGGRLSKLQEAFLQCGGAQCGACTPGMLVAASVLPKRASRDEIAVALAGNLCRCTGYVKIFDAVQKALKMIHGSQLEVLRPRSLKDALTMLRDEGPLTPLAGGTDLFVGLNAGSLPREGRRFLDLWHLDALRGIDKDGKWLRLGALTTYTDCIRSRKVGRALPILQEAAREIGGVQIQNRGTLAGNIGNGSPAGDSLPVLMAADAEVILQSKGDGKRAVALSEYYTGYRASVRRPDELIVGIRFKIPRKKERQLFRKVGTRAAQAISKIVMAQVGNRVAFGSVAPVVMRARKLESYLIGGGRDLSQAQQLLLDEIKPIDDIRSTAEYRRRVASNLVSSLF